MGKIVQSDTSSKRQSKSNSPDQSYASKKSKASTTAKTVK
jgi:hypothetical protein